MIGILATTNAIIRKDPWIKYHFNENYKNGGEDWNWASYWLRQGYVIVQDPRFRVYHSHNLGIFELLIQIYKAWSWTRQESSKQKYLAAPLTYFKSLLGNSTQLRNYRLKRPR